MSTFDKKSSPSTADRSAVTELAQVQAATIRHPSALNNPHPGAIPVARALSETLLAVSMHAQAISDLLTDRIRDGDPTAKKQLRLLHNDLRSLHTVSETVLHLFNTRLDLFLGVPLLSPLGMPVQSTHDPKASLSTLRKKVHDLEGWLLTKTPQDDLHSRLISPASELLEMMQEITERIVSQLPPGLSPPSPYKKISEREEIITPEEFEQICSVIMKHHREPGDPTIEDKGVVISNITPRWVRARIEDNHQLIKCIQGEKLLGVSFFNAPESCPKHLRELNERFPKTRNATLTLMLVAPEAQGQGVFHLLMNATLTALQATGADLLIGEVEHTNERAKSAYAKFNGVIHPDISSPHRAPNGDMTAFLGLSIPIVPDAR